MNRILMLTAVTALGLAACSRKEAEPAPPPAPVVAVAPAPAPAAPAPAAAALPSEATAIVAYVDQVEAEFKDKYQRTEVTLTADMLKGVTDAAWAKLHAYADQGAVKRIKLYPAEGGSKVEEFYFRDGQLVYVSDEPSGTDQGREQYFFAAGQLLAATEPDGRMTTLTDAETQKGKKLLAEAEAFLKIATRK